MVSQSRGAVPIDVLPELGPRRFGPHVERCGAHESDVYTRRRLLRTLQLCDWCGEGFHFILSFRQGGKSILRLARRREAHRTLRLHNRLLLRTVLRTVPMWYSRRMSTTTVKSHTAPLRSRLVPKALREAAGLLKRKLKKTPLQHQRAMRKEWFYGLGNQH